MAEGRYLAFVAHSDHLINGKWCHRFISHIIDSQLTHSSMHASHQPGDSGGGPWYGQLRDLALLDYFHHSEDHRHAKDDWAVFEPWVIHHDSYLVFVVPLNTGYLNVHHNESFWIHHDTPYTHYWRNFSSHFLS